MKKKLMALLSLVLVIAMALSACGAPAESEAPAGDTSTPDAETPATDEEPEAPSGETKELLLWLPPFGTEDTFDLEYWSEATADWATENNVDLSIEITPWSGYGEKYLTGFSSGAGPDVGYMYSEMIGDFIDMGAIQTIDSNFSQEEIDNYIYWDNGMIKGGQYGLPFIVGNARLIFVNMDIMEQAGVTELPTTWDEFVDTLLQVKENVPDVMPFAQNWADTSIGSLNTIYYPFMWQAGGLTFDENGEIALTSNDGAVEAAQFVYDLMHVHGVVTEASLGLTTTSDEFKAGNLAMHYQSASFAKQIEDMNWDFIPSLTNETDAIWIASDVLVMSAATEDAALTASLMKHITSAPVMEGFHTELSPYPPITKDAAYIDTERFKPVYEDMTEYLRSLPVADNAYTISDTLYKNLQLMIQDSMTPEEAIQATVDYANSLG